MSNPVAFKHPFDASLMRQWVREEVRLQKTELKQIQNIFVPDNFKDGFEYHYLIRDSIFVETKREVRTLRCFPFISTAGSVPKLVPWIDYGMLVKGELYKVKDETAIKTLDIFHDVETGRGTRFYITVCTYDPVWGDIESIYRAVAWFTLDNPKGVAVNEYKKEWI